MATLLDTIRQQTGALAGTQAPITDTTGQVQGLLRAKSGKAVGGEAGSNLGEQAAVSDTQTQLQAQAPQIAAQQQATDIAAQRQTNDFQAQQAGITQAKKFDTAENQVKVQQLMSGLARDKDTLDVDKDKSRLEQTAFLLSMQDKQYVSALQDIGNKQRLDNAAQFQQEQQKLAFGSSLDLLKQQIGQADILSLSDENYKKAISSLSIDQIVQMSQLEIQDLDSQAQTDAELQRYKSNQTAVASGLQARSTGLQELVKAGAQAGAAYRPGTSNSGTSSVTDTSAPSTEGLT